ncbi:MAG TPA: hypothetical protein PK079_02185 [Leptospiraceae bacterium]|nr:hypothetical protein [Leptospiraceae bacterium]HMW03526.1 hypothetical protein [Leptospiraceae bacterium]HMX33911.1 hypothetical protein [Leptospiraceae bacterium]HMY29554.1 hypothetical protein [Leptospiraceae bacterium]HMZ67574.1 hypothetical protein [Leptospiraceae bacterium]
MQEEYTPEKIIEIINSAAHASLEQTKASKAERSKVPATGFTEKEISKLLENTANEIVRKEEVDYLANRIKNRFAKIKAISKENFNMFEVAMQCHRLVNDYRALAKQKGWKEIEAMFSRKENL